jgi:hypothetical protein
MIPYKWPVATAIPQNPVVRREIAEAMQAFLEDGDEQLRQRRAEIASLRQGLDELGQEIARFRRDAPALLLSELRKYGYNPDEPRVPEGNPGPGRWTRVAAGSNPQLLSDAAPNNPGEPPSQYATNDVSDEKTNDNLTAEQVCKQAYADGIASVRKNPSLSPEEYLGARYQLASALELCLRLARGLRPVSRDGNFVEFYGAGVVIFRPGRVPLYRRWQSSND